MSDSENRKQDMEFMAYEVHRLKLGRADGVDEPVRGLGLGLPDPDRDQLITTYEKIYTTIMTGYQDGWTDPYTRGEVDAIVQWSKLKPSQKGNIKPVVARDARDIFFIDEDPMPEHLYESPEEPALNAVPEQSRSLQIAKGIGNYLLRGLRETGRFWLAVPGLSYPPDLGRKAEPDQ